MPIFVGSVASNILLYWSFSKRFFTKIFNGFFFYYLSDVVDLYYIYVIFLIIFVGLLCVSINVFART